jgi:hypothetical protein
MKGWNAAASDWDKIRYEATYEALNWLSESNTSIEVTLSGDYICPPQAGIVLHSPACLKSVRNITEVS